MLTVFEKHIKSQAVARTESGLSLACLLLYKFAKKRGGFMLHKLAIDDLGEDFHLARVLIHEGISLNPAT